MTTIRNPIDNCDTATPVWQIEGLSWVQVDVFADQPLSGNAVAVFPDAGGLTPHAMLSLTRELRVFEAIFLSAEDNQGRYPARIFTADEELNFAGHPILGAAVAIAHLNEFTDSEWVFEISGRAVSVTVRKGATAYRAEMDQGPAVLGPPLAAEAVKSLLGRLGLTSNLQPRDLPTVMASTGLPYIIVPVTPEGLQRAQIRGEDFEDELAKHGGKFVYVLDTDTFEGRSWDNLGRVEDIATGSAAGPAAEYLWKYCAAPENLTVKQGRFTGRPSRIDVRGDPVTDHVLVAGQSHVVAQGRFL